jgi:hypothetical protein
MPTTPRAENGTFAKTAFTLLITGSRTWDNIAAIRDALVEVRDLAKSLDLTPSQVTLVHGNAQGADRTCGTFGAMLGFNVISVPADWNKHYFVTDELSGAERQACRCVLDKDAPGYKNYCKMAGIVRNLHMLDNYKPDMVLAFNRDNSSGTMHTMKEARKRGLILKVVNYDASDSDASTHAVTQDASSQVTTTQTPTSGATVTDDPFAKFTV